MSTPKVTVAAVLTLAAALTIFLAVAACTSSEPTPVPTVEKARDTAQSLTATPIPNLTTKKDQFVAQVTKMAPYRAESRNFVPTIVANEGQHEQWVLLAVSPTEQQKAQFGLAGGKSINDRKGQQYTCAFYLDGAEVPRINLAFHKDLTYHSVVTNQYGELQGAINATTTVNGTTILLEWRTWPSRADRIRLRGDHAVRLVHEIRERNASEFELTLHDNQGLSKTYDVRNLIDAIAINGMTCFAGR